MAAQPRVLIAGGYGTFGRLLAHELVSLPIDLRIAGRDLDKAAALCRTLGPSATPIAIDLAEPGALQEAARDCFAVACAAGPFQDLDRRLVREAIAAGAHWLDIADHAEWVLGIVDDPRLQGASRAILTGLSSTPAITGALARWCAERVEEPERARVSMFIGNRNTKGAGAIASVLAGGFDDPQPVSFPIGTKSAYRFPSADAELVRRALGVETEMRVALEWRAAAILAAAASRAKSHNSVARVLSRIARPFGVLGSNVGVVQAEVWGDRYIGAALSMAGQRIAIIPCAIALEDLLGSNRRIGADAAALLQPDEWVRRLRSRGAQFLVRRSNAPNSGASPAL